MTTLEIANLYFELSNKSDFENLAKLFTDSTTYSSSNTGEYVGGGSIITMQKAFHSKFSNLHWQVNKIAEVKSRVIQFDYNFKGTTLEGEVIRSSGLEYVTISDEDKIQDIEIRNK